MKTIWKKEKEREKMQTVQIFEFAFFVAHYMLRDFRNGIQKWLV